jgi:hypothetical protein
MKKLATIFALTLLPFSASAQEAPQPVISTQAAPSLVGLGGLGAAGTIVVGAVVLGGIVAIVSDEGTSGTSGTSGS